MLCIHHLLDCKVIWLHTCEALQHCFNQELLEINPMGMWLRISSGVNNIESLCVLQWKV